MITRGLFGEIGISHSARIVDGHSVFGAGLSMLCIPSVVGGNYQVWFAVADITINWAPFLMAAMLFSLSVAGKNSEIANCASTTYLTKEL